jgi:hypothetical protein
MPSFENAHALIIGITDYQHVNKLPVVTDAPDIYNTLIDPVLCGYPPKPNVVLLQNGEATQAAVRKALADLAARTDEGSTVFIYFSGHGGRIESGAHAGQYLLPVDALYPDDAALAGTAISGGDFTTALNRIRARKVIVIFDCCHAGGIGQPKDPITPEVKAGLSEGYYDSLRGGRGRVIIASSREVEFSFVLPGSSLSLFTQHLLAGLRGGTPGPGGVVRIFDLFHYLQPRVTADHPSQHPIFKCELEENFPIALYHGGEAAATPLPAPPGDFQYDVFVSYRQKEPDRGWVRKVLVPWLEAAGLHACVDYRDFIPGALLVQEMERAVLKSRYTLAVLTPRYLQSNFTDLESALAQHLGLEKAQRRFLAVMREDCEPRLGIRARLWLDMIDDSEFERNAARLNYELRRPPGT